nr:MAG TPA: hypothetical protein [Caudoviricetes sp.]
MLIPCVCFNGYPVSNTTIFPRPCRHSRNSCFTVTPGFPVP